MQRLSAVADDMALVLVVAPPGYGKTTAVGQWAGTTAGQVAWLTVTGQHQDRQRFVHDLALAMELTRSAGDGLGRLAASLADAPPEEAPARLAAGAAGRPVTIVLDDLHLLRTRAALDLVLAVAVLLPLGCRIVAIGDRQPRLQIGRLLSEGRCVEVGPDQLAFSREETRPSSRRPAWTSAARRSTSYSGGRRAGRRGCSARCAP